MAPGRTILTFHRIADDSSHVEHSLDAYSVGYSTFLQILDFVSSNPEIKITFDDGNVSDYSIALPALLERKLSATFFVASEMVDRSGYMSKEQVRYLVKNGFEVGSHGALHRDWRTLSDDELNREINYARKDLQDWLGVKIGCISIPFGSYERRVLAFIEEACFDHVYTSDGGRTTDESWIQPRNTIHGGYSIASVARLLKKISRPFPRIKRDVKMFIKKRR
jgi:peptidoglycan/xylan/chitin deacetylase (PgdA/CDA1 family)